MREPSFITAKLWHSESANSHFWISQGDSGNIARECRTIMLIGNIWIGENCPRENKTLPRNKIVKNKTFQGSSDKLIAIEYETQKDRNWSTRHHEKSQCHGNHEFSGKTPSIRNFCEVQYSGTSRMADSSWIYNEMAKSFAKPTICLQLQMESPVFLFVWHHFFQVFAFGLQAYAWCKWFTRRYSALTSFPYKAPCTCCPIECIKFYSKSYNRQK